MAKNKDTKNSPPTIEQTEQFEMLFPILESVYNEIKELSKKKQDGALNEVKVKMTNRILSKVKAVLQNDPSIEFLDLLDEVSMPTNSDAVMIIAQFIAAMEQFKKKNFIWTGMRHEWDTAD